MRQNRDHNLPDVAAYRKLFRKKREGPNGQLGAMSGQKNCPVFDVKNYDAERPAGEDDASIEKHIANMKLEHRHKVKDQHLIEVAMDRTFGDRRTYIIGNSPSIADVKEIYPCLFSYTQVTC